MERTTTSSRFIQHDKMDDDTVSLDASHVGSLFPFYFCCDSQMRLLSWGQAMPAFCPGIARERRFERCFRFYRPAINGEFSIVASCAGTLLFLHVIDREGAMWRGQVLPLSNGSLLFVGWPWVSSADDLAHLGLRLRDFPLHNPIADLLVLLKTSLTTVADARQLAERLKQRKLALESNNRELAEFNRRLQEEIERRERAECLLKQANELLEQRIAARTRELVELNQALQREAAESRAGRARYTELYQRLNLALDASGTGIWYWHGEEERFHGDAYAASLLGLPTTTDEIGWPAFIARVHPQDRDWVAELMRRQLGEGEVHGLEFRVLHDDGDVRHLIANGKTLSSRAVGPGRVAGVFVDRTATMLSRQALSESEQRYRRLADLSKDAFLLEQDSRFIYVNAAGLELFGVQSSEELMCRPSCEFLILPRGRANSGLYAALETSIRRSDGTEVEVELFGMSSVYRGKPAFQWVIRDISERKHYQRQLEHQAKHDPLTGLPNRSEFLHRVQRLLRGDYQPQLERWAVVFLDLDHFKYVNDSLGHSAGDQLLKQVAQRLSAALRRDDLVARLGGDEFGMLLPLQRDEKCDAVIERIMAAVRQPLKLPRSAHSVSCSLGVSLFERPEHTELSAESLLQQADAAMYRAKESGRNTFRFFSRELNQRIDERFRLESRLRHAIQNRELALYLQPQVSLDHGAVVACEALLRWHSPVEGTVPPDRFIPIAEQSGLIVSIGDWVLEQACRQISAWVARGLSIPISVNVSAVQLEQQDFAERVSDCLERCGAPAALLELEITESMSMISPEDTIEVLRRLGQRGVSLSIDDFGTGYSNLAYLKRYPVSKIKIDRSFVQPLGESPADLAIVDAAIRMAHALELKVVAEGVETAEQEALLQRLACDYAQGYYYQHPLPAAECSALLDRRGTTPLLVSRRTGS